jgi:hypothetical protein
MKDTLRLLPFHLRMLPCVVTIPYQFGSSRGLPTCTQPCKQGLQLECTLLLTKDNLLSRIKPLSNDSVRHVRRQNTHTAGERLEQICCLDIFTTRPSPPAASLYVSRDCLVFQINISHGSMYYMGRAVTKPDKVNIWCYFYK